MRGKILRRLVIEFSNYVNECPRCRRTKKEIVEFAQGILAAFPNGISFNITGITAEDERVAVEISGEAIHASGHEYNNKYHFLLIIKDGKILELKEYMDTQLAAKILLGE